MIVNDQNADWFCVRRHVETYCGNDPLVNHRTQLHANNTFGLLRTGIQPLPAELDLLIKTRVDLMRNSIGKKQRKSEGILSPENIELSPRSDSLPISSESTHGCAISGA